MPAAHLPHWPPCRSAAPTQSKRSRGFRCTRTGQRLANAEAATSGAQRYRALADVGAEHRRQRRRGASAQRWRGAHSVRPVNFAGFRHCSHLVFPLNKYRYSYPDSTLHKYSRILYSYIHIDQLHSLGCQK
jgi:hypothetical protein